MLEDLCKNNKPLFMALVAAIVLIGLAMNFMGSLSKNPTLEDEIISLESPNTANAAGFQNKSDGSLFVDISGAVKKPGVYKLAFGSRVVDLIKASGGLLKNAQVDEINLAKQVKDGEKISVRFKSGSEAIVNSGSAPSGGKVDINSAGEASLDSIPGVGLSTAKKIIEYRTKNGRFSKPEDLMEIPGIGKGKFERMKGTIVAN